MVSIATLTSKGQITIPKLVRDRLGLRAGDQLDFTVEPDGTMTVAPLGAGGERRPLAGFLNDVIRPQAAVTVEEMDRVMREHVARRVTSGLVESNVVADDDRA